MEGDMTVQCRTSSPSVWAARACTVGLRLRVTSLHSAAVSEELSSQLQAVSEAAESRAM
jgi:hypothetical protein